MRFFILFEKHIAIVIPPWEALLSCWPVEASYIVTRLLVLLDTTTEAYSSIRTRS